MTINCSEEISLIVTGDFCPDARVEDLCVRGNYEKIYNEALPILKNKDFSITNLECPLTDKTNRILKSGPHLKANPKCIDAIKYGGFDAVTLGNNHILDQGDSGLYDTKSMCKDAGIKTVGVGENIQESCEPLYVHIGGKDLAILNFAENEFSIAGENSAGANPLNAVANYYQITEAKKNASVVLVIVHGGHEYYHLPSPRMVETYRFFAELGATAVIGHHTHCPSGFETYKGVPIFYSLGNFIFDRRYNNFSGWFKGYFVNLIITDCSVRRFELFPYFQCYNSVGLNLMDGDQKKQFIKELDWLSKVIQDPKLLAIEWNRFCENREVEYLSRLLRYGRIRRQLIKRKLFRKFIMRRGNLARLLNMFMCESHREVVVSAITKEISRRQKA